MFTSLPTYTVSSLKELLQTVLNANYSQGLDVIVSGSLGRLKCSGVQGCLSGGGADAHPQLIALSAGMCAWSFRNTQRDSTDLITRCWPGRLL